MNTASRIARLRTDLSLSQDYVARYLGMPVAAYAQIEAGIRNTSADEATKLGKLFGVSAGSLQGNPQTTKGATAMDKPVYIHYGAKKFDPHINFPISNKTCWNKPEGGLWASRADADFGWIDWCKEEHFRKYDKDDCFKFTMRNPDAVFTVHNYDDLQKLPWNDFWYEPGYHYDPWWYMIDFEECRDSGIDAIELCWYGKDCEHPTELNMETDLHYSLGGWDCDSIVVLNPDAVVPLRKDE